MKFECTRETFIPDLDGERVHEREEPGGLPAGDLEEDADAEVHEGLREVDDGLPRKVYGHGAHGQVRPPLLQF